MSDATAAAELLGHARDFASSGTDLYALLGVDATTTKSDIHRAWRKASLQYHPDKAKDKFDPEKWQQFERARDVLADPPAREAYDAQRSASLMREQARMAMDDKRRRMVEDLEAREKAGRDVQKKDGGGEAGVAGENVMSEAERRKTAEAGRRRVEERQRLMREAEERERQRAAEKDEADLKREADLERRIGEIQAKKAAKTAARQQQQQQKDKDEDVEMTDGAAVGAAEAGGRHAAQPTAQEETRPHVLEALRKAEKLAAEAAAIPRVRGDFSHTYARLKAAQAAKEARQLAREGTTA